MGRDSLAHSFVDEPTKNRLLAEYDKRIVAFVGQFQKGGWGSLKSTKPRDLLRSSANTIQFASSEGAGSPPPPPPLGEA